MMSQTFNMDCMEGLKSFPDKYFDLAIVDPPYGIKQDGHRKNNRSKVAVSKEYHKALWDQAAPCEGYFIELKRVSKHQIIFGANHFISRMPFDSSCWIVWDKVRSGNFADCELAWTSFDTAVRMFTFEWNGMRQQDMKNREARIHPTQKPVALYRWLLKNYATPGSKILDTHLGSGSSRIACHECRFEFVGFEIDRVYFYDQETRFEQYLSQLQLNF